jgi:hypothetical protein
MTLISFHFRHTTAEHADMSGFFTISEFDIQLDISDIEIRIRNRAGQVETFYKSQLGSKFTEVSTLLLLGSEISKYCCRNFL